MKGEHMTQSVTSAEFEQKVLNCDLPVLVDFSASWCGPCRMMAPVIEEISADMAGKAEVYKLDIDENPDIARQYGVASVPTFIVFKDGQPVRGTIGAQPKENIAQLLA